MADLRGLRALVTGASSGIGAAVATELATRGVDLVITSRSREALDAVAARCNGVTVEVVVADLGAVGGAKAVWSAATALRPIDILVNNAGFGYFRPFGTVEWARDAELIQLNMTSLVELTRRFVDARHDRPGYLMNIASTAAYQSIPNMSLYAASKAFVRNFTEGLHHELRGGKLSATCVCPGGTRTSFHEMAGAGDYSWIAQRSMMSAERVARIAVRAMIGRRRTVVPGTINKIQAWGIRLIPGFLASWMSRLVLGPPKRGQLPPRAGAA